MRITLNLFYNKKGIGGFEIFNMIGSKTYHYLLKSVPNVSECSSRKKDTNLELLYNLFSMDIW